MSSVRTPNIEASVRALVEYLKQKLAGVEVFEGFPDPTRKLRMPSISILSQAPRLSNDLAGAHQVAISEVVEHQADVLYGVGDYEFEMQLDIWCASRADRELLYQKLFEKLNPNIEPMGLTISLDEYHEQKCHYLLTGYDYKAFDGEQSAQRGEWRASLSCVATCKAIRERRDNIIETVEVTLETPDNIPKPEDEET